jgi:peroxiredoxin
MSLANQLSAVYENFRQNAPASVSEPIKAASQDIQASFQPELAIQVGTTLPDFHLSDAVGKKITRADLLAKGPLLISFYRGEWCPFCNLALVAMQKHLEQYKAKGVTLVAISPELPNQSLSTTEKHDLKFPVLSDVGNKLAKELGILWIQPDSLRPIFDNFGHNLKDRNGDNTFAVPLPATILVDQSGVVRNTFINPDYTKRLEPAVTLGWIDEL